MKKLLGCFVGIFFALGCELVLAQNTGEFLKPGLPPEAVEAPPVELVDIPLSRTTNFAALRVFSQEELTQEHRIKLESNGAYASYGVHVARFPADVNGENPVRMVTPDGRALAFRPTFLSLRDTQTGEGLLIAQITNRTGLVVGTNKVVYTNAFAGINADVRLIYTAHSLEQDIIFHEQPALPEGFTAENTRLEVWTEWFDSEPSARRSQRINLRQTLAGIGAVESSDEILDFGSMTIGLGYAFTTQASEKIPVAKAWGKLAERHWLVETVDYLATEIQLEKLPVRTAHATPGQRGSQEQLIRSLKNPPKDLPSPKAEMLMVKGHVSGAAEFVMDFVIVATVPAPSGIVSWWPAGGNANDVVTNNHGILYGGSYAAGQVGQAFKLYGGNHHVRIPNTASLRLTNALTFEAWLYPTNTGSYRDVFSKWDAVAGFNQKSFDTSLHADGRFYLLISPNGTDTGAVYAITTNSVPTNVWTHVAGTYDGSVIKVYLNGVMESQGSYTGKIFPGTNSLGIGGATGGALPGNMLTPFPGIIDEPSLYNRALSDSEIKSVFDAGIAGKRQPTCVSASTNIVGWWPGDGNNYDFARTNFAALKSGATYGAARVSRGFSFDGSDDYVEVTNSWALNPTNGLTVEAWVYRTGGAGQNVPIFSKDDTSSMRQYLLTINPSSKFQAHVWTTTSGLVNFPGATSVSLSGWYHVAMTYNGTNLVLYVNGVSDGSASASGKIITGTDPLRIGGSYSGVWGNYKFAGMIDEPTVYDRALSASEIAAIYTAGSAGKCKLDSDSDGLSDMQEIALGTNPNLADSDGDGIKDGDEVFVNFTDPTNPDTDYDGRKDGQELTDKTDPLNATSALQVRLGYWKFNDSVTWASESGQPAWSFAGVSAATSWSGTALTIGNAYYTHLLYHDVDADNTPTINLRKGTLRFWFKPNWSSVSFGGTGPSTPASLFKLGNGSVAFWSLSIDGAGDNIAFVTAADGVTTTNIASGVSWKANDWHEIVLAYDPGYVKLYIDGLATSETGVGIQHYPDRVIQAQGFTVGGRWWEDSLAKGQFEELETFNYVVNPVDIANNFNSIYQSRDSDGDGLTDLEEVVIPVDVADPSKGMLDPFDADTGNTGQTDGLKDADHDGLSNLAELRKYDSDPSDLHTYTLSKSDPEYLFTARPGDTSSLVRYTIADLGGGAKKVIITSAPADGSYEVYFNPDLFSKWRRIYRGVPGQREFILPDPNPGAGFYLLLDAEDDDKDGLSNGLEAFASYGGLRTGVSHNDTDEDGMRDGWEVTYGLDPTANTGVNGETGDSDEDHYSNINEYAPNVDLTAAAFDPLKPYASVSQPPRPIVSITTADAMGDQLGGGASFTIRRLIGVGGNLSSPLKVYYSVGGSLTYLQDFQLVPAPPTTDYPRIFSATIPANASEITVAVTPLPNGVKGAGTKGIIIQLTPYGLSTVPQSPTSTDWAYVVNVYEQAVTVRVQHGMLINLQQTAAGSLVIPPTADTTPLPYLNLANSKMGTVVRLYCGTNLVTDPSRVVGEYFTSPERMERNPSRTTVDRFGNVWVGNRAQLGEGSIAQFGLIVGGERGDKGSAPDAAGKYHIKRDANGNSLNPNGDYLEGPFLYNSCIDRDGDGLIRTSGGKGHVLSWANAGGADSAGGVSTAEDEAILRYIRVASPAVRTVAVDTNNNLWVGGQGKDANPPEFNWFESIDAKTGMPFTGRKATFRAAGYGGVVDGLGNVWSSGWVSSLLRFNPGNGSFPFLAKRFDRSTEYYGITVDPNTSEVWQAWYGNDRDPLKGGAVRIGADNVLSEYRNYIPQNRGIVIDGKKNVWVGSTDTRVSHFTTDGNFLGSVSMKWLPPNGPEVNGQTPIGVAVDSIGMIWAVCESGHLMRIDPSKGVTPAGSTRAVGKVVEYLEIDTGPYNYSDMTGFVTLAGTQPSGTWCFVKNSGVNDTLWTSMNLDATVYSGTKIFVEVRAANTYGDMSSMPFIPLADSQGKSVVGVTSLPAGVKGKYLEVRANLIKDFGVVASPELKELTFVSDSVGCALFIGSQGHPKGRSIEIGANVTFTVNPALPSGTTATYQWLKDGATVANGGHVSGATTPTLTINNADYSDAGSYSAKVGTVTGCSFQIESSPARLHVKGDAPVIVQDPQSAGINSGGSATLVAQANSSERAGAKPIYYQWLRDGQPIAGASGNCGAGNCNITRTLSWKCENAGIYSVLFWNKYGQTTTKDCSVSIYGFPMVSVNPANVNVTSLDQVIVLTGTATVCFPEASHIQWYFTRNGGSRTAIPGATALNYTVPTPIDCKKFGTYTMVVSTSEGYQLEASAILVADAPTVNLLDPILTIVPDDIGSGAWSYKWQWATTAQDDDPNYEVNTVLQGTGDAYASFTVPRIADRYYRVIATRVSGAQAKAKFAIFPGSISFISQQTGKMGMILRATATGLEDRQWTFRPEGGTEVDTGVSIGEYSVSAVDCSVSGIFQYKVFAACSEGRSVSWRISVPPPQVTLPAPEIQIAPDNIGSDPWNFVWHSSDDDTTYTLISGATTAGYKPQIGNKFYRVTATRTGAEASARIWYSTWSGHYFLVHHVMNGNLGLKFTPEVTGFLGTGNWNFRWYLRDDSYQVLKELGNTPDSFTLMPLQCDKQGTFVAEIGDKCGIGGDTEAVAGVYTQPPSISLGNPKLEIKPANVGVGDWSFVWQASDDNSTYTTISGQTTAVYTPPQNVNRFYRVTATRTGATATARLYYAPAPSGGNRMVSEIATSNAGLDLTYTPQVVGVKGNGTWHYKLKLLDFNYQVVSDLGSIPGAFTVSGVNCAKQGVYQLQLSDDCGTTVDSEAYVDVWVEGCP